MLGNPLAYVDPSGHRQICGPSGKMCSDEEEWSSTLTWLYEEHHPAPGKYWAVLEDVRISEYYTAAEKDFTGGKTITIQGHGPYKEDFVYDFAGVAGQGSGVSEEGTTLGVRSNPSDNWDHSTNPPTLLDRSKVDLFTGKALPLPMKQIAVASASQGGHIPKGAKVYIRELDVQLGDRHDGFVWARDTGDLKGHRIDFYAGVGRAAIFEPPDFGDDANHTIYYLASERP